MYLFPRRWKDLHKNWVEIHTLCPVLGGKRAWHDAVDQQCSLRQVFLWAEFHMECTRTLTRTFRFRRGRFVCARILNYWWIRRDCVLICCDARHFARRAGCRVSLSLASIHCRLHFSTCRPSWLLFVWVLEDKSESKPRVSSFLVFFCFFPATHHGFVAESEVKIAFIIARNEIM